MCTKQSVNFLFFSSVTLIELLPCCALWKYLLVTPQVCSHSILPLAFDAIIQQPFLLFTHGKYHPLMSQPRLHQALPINLNWFPTDSLSPNGLNDLSLPVTEFPSLRFTTLPSFTNLAHCIRQQHQLYNSIQNIGEWPIIYIGILSQSHFTFG